MPLVGDTETLTATLTVVASCSIELTASALAPASSVTASSSAQTITLTGVALGANTGCTGASWWLEASSTNDASTNNHRLMNGTDPIPYTLHVGTTPSSANAFGTFPGTGGASSNYSAGVIGGTGTVLVAEATVPANPVAGTYTDTITLTINY